MARDAFGNEIREDPFGGGLPPFPPPPPGPDFAGPGPGPGGGPRPGGPPRAPLVVRAAGRIFSTLLAFLILGGLGAAGYAIFDRVSDGVDDTRRAISTGLDGFTVPTPATPTTSSSSTPSTSGGRRPEAPAVPAVPPVGFGRGSLLLRSNFADALRLLRAEGSRVQTLRVAADRIDASVITPAGTRQQVQVTWQGKRSRLGPSTPAGTSVGTVALATLDRAAPFRLARSAAGRSKRSPASIDYLVALDLGGRSTWTVFLKNQGGQYVADLRGRITRRVG